MDQFDPQIQSTLQYWPASDQLRQKLSIPLSISINPTSQQNNNASFNQKNMQKYRCQSCKAFINKFCQIRNENQYDCSLCGFSNQINQPISFNSVQMSSISYKCKASKIQRIIINKQRVFVFLIDFSNYDQLTQKYLLYSIHAIRQFIKRAIKDKINIKIMLLGFDNGIQLFSLKNQISRVMYWEDDTNNINEIPFNQEKQIVNVNQCQENIFTVLNVLEEEINQRKFKSNSKSKKILDTIQYVFKHTKVESGKIFVITGLNHQLQKFKVMRNFDSTIKDQLKNHFPTVKRQCINQKLLDLINSTQMSVSLFFHKNSYSNLMPFYILTKITNGQLRHYAKNQTEHFFYQFNYLLHQCLYQMKYETLLRVRTASGLKLVGIFGNYRPWKGIQQQIQMLSCESNRKYTFQFVIEGKINSPQTIVQFSVLYTDLKGNRFYKIITQNIQLSYDINKIITGINYENVNQTYLKAILHNMDITPHVKKLQQALKQRCKKHVKMLKLNQIQKQNLKFNRIISNSEIFESDYMKKVKNYAIFTYLLINHFFMNIPQKRDVFWDYNTQIRSKINTFDDSVKLIWPIVYIISQNGYEVVEMKAENYEKTNLGIVIDRGDQIFLYIKDIKLRNQLKRSKDLKRAVKQTQGLQNINYLLEQIQQSKFYPHLDIFLSQENILYSFNIFNWQGNKGFQNYIQELIPN